MLRKIAINNIALIDRLEIDFMDGLTVLSGETGSGKSIIVDSLGFVLGERADKTLIKHGQEEAHVTVLFTVDADCPVLTKLAEYGFPAEREILVSRTMSVSGKNEIRIQGKMATLSILKEVCSELVDIFGQGQHLALLNEKNQLSVLDSFCDFGDLDEKLKKLCSKLSALNRELKAFGGTDAERERLADILKYQIDEIRNAELDEAEEADLLVLHKRMVNVEKITQAFSQAVQCLNGESGAIAQLSYAEGLLHFVSSVEDSAEDLAERLNQSSAEVQDVCETLERILDSTEFSPAEADRIETRLEHIKTVKRKYGGTIKDALDFLRDAEYKYDNLQNSTERIEQLTAERNKILREAYQLSRQKSAVRKRTAEDLSRKIMSELAQLGMKGTDFEVSFNDEPSFEQYCSSPSANGFDSVVFLMSANAGEPLKPLSKVISGGEMSRFMLAVKNITALAEKIPTMVFDEIDTGISGVMAQMVAQKLAQVSSKKRNSFQCIVITHLPQIVAMSDLGFYIFKQQADDRTITTVMPLWSDDQKVREIARLMGGVGEHALISARELLDWSRQYKANL